MRLTLISCALLALIPVTAGAVGVSITNAGFESDALAVGGWSDAPPSGWADPAGASNGNFLENITGFASDGFNHLGFDQTTDGGVGMVYQDLSTAWAPNTTYTLTVGVGNRSGWGAGTGRFGFGSSSDAAPSPGVLNTPSVFFSDVNTALAAPVTGTFADLTISFSTGAVAPAGNIRLSVQRISDGGPRLHIDNVRLDAIPEPSTAAALALAAGLLLRRRRA
jgi:hypothetical protein